MAIVCRGPLAALPARSSWCRPPRLPSGRPSEGSAPGGQTNALATLSRPLGRTASRPLPVPALADLMLSWSIPPRSTGPSGKNHAPARPAMVIQHLSPRSHRIVCCSPVPHAHDHCGRRNYRAGVHRTVITRGQSHPVHRPDPLEVIDAVDSGVDGAGSAAWAVSEHLRCPSGWSAEDVGDLAALEVPGEPSDEMRLFPVPAGPWSKTQ